MHQNKYLHQYIKLSQSLYLTQKQAFNTIKVIYQYRSSLFSTRPQTQNINLLRAKTFQLHFYLTTNKRSLQFKAQNSNLHQTK